MSLPKPDTDTTVVITGASSGIGRAAALSIASNAAGHVHMSMTPLVTVEEMDQAIAKSGKYGIPG